MRTKFVVFKQHVAHNTVRRLRSWGATLEQPPWLLEIVSLSRDVANLSKCAAAELGTAPPETLSGDGRPYTRTHLVRESETILSATVSWPRGRVNSVCCVRAWLGQFMLVSCNAGFMQVWFATVRERSGGIGFLECRVQASLWICGMAQLGVAYEISEGGCA